MRFVPKFRLSPVAAMSKLIPRSGLGITVCLAILAGGVNLAEDANLLSSLSMQATAEVADEWSGF